MAVSKDEGAEGSGIGMDAPAANAVRPARQLDAELTSRSATDPARDDAQALLATGREAERLATETRQRARLGDPHAQEIRRWQETDGSSAERRSALGQQRDRFTLELSGVENATLIGFRGYEAISTLYRFEIGLSVEHTSDFDMRALLGERGCLNLDTPQGALRQHGIAAAVELVADYASRSFYLVTLVPELWHLEHMVHSRIFTNASIPQIIEAVLSHSGISAFSLQCGEAYAPLEHVCQYRESNFAFISRLMEREGMYYFFEQADSGEQLVITDARSAHRALGGRPLHYGHWAQGEADREAVETFRCRMGAMPASVQFSDYNYLKPQLTVTGSAAVVPEGRGEIVMYGDNVLTPDEGSRRARIKAEAYRAAQTIYEGGGTVTQLRAGYLFSLEGHPRGHFNRPYLVTELQQRGRQVFGVPEMDALLGLAEGEQYRTEFKAIPDDVQYRSPRHTAWPRIDGVVDGVVDGAGASPYAQLDADGRYKVRVFFDESDLVDGSSSTWVRMLQPHGGGAEGFHFPLRKGTEVHLIFLGGDPDRPVIVGVAPNPLTPAPVTAHNNTQNVLQTGGNNRLEMEDSDGAQHVTMSTPTESTFLHMGAGDYNFVQSTNGHGREYVGGNRDGVIEGNMTESVTGTVNEQYAATRDTTVVGALTETFTDTHDRTVTGAVSMTLLSSLTEDITGAASRTVHSTSSDTVAGAVTIHFENVLDETVDGAITHTSNSNVTEVHNADKTTTVAGSHTLDVVGEQSIHSYALQNMSAPTQTFQADGEQIHLADTHAVEASTLASTTAPTVTINGDGSVTITSAAVTIDGGTVVMQGGTLTVNKQAVVINGGSVAIDGGGNIDMTAGVIKLN